MPTDQSHQTELEKVQSIINQEIRPALQMHGGEVEAVSVEGTEVKINYRGACGGCPGATTATLAMITTVLRDQYKPDVVVRIA